MCHVSSINNNKQFVSFASFLDHHLPTIASFPDHPITHIPNPSIPTGNSIMPPSNHTNPTKPVSLNDRISVYWPMDDQFFPGVVTNLLQDGKTVVHYDDGDVETLLLSNETWNFVQPAKPSQNDSSPQIPPTTSPVAQSRPEKLTSPKKDASVRRGTASTASPGSTDKHGNPVTTKSSVPRKRSAPSSAGATSVSKKPVTATRQLSVVNKSVNNTPTVPVTVATFNVPPVSHGISASSHPKPTPRVSVARRTAQPQLARPITSGVPLSSNEPPPPPQPSQATQQPDQPPLPNIQQVLEPLMTSFNAQLNTQVSRISSIRTMLLNLTPRLNELDDRCKTLRADVDNLESEVTSRAEMNKLLNAAFVKQMDELNRSQTLILERLKNDFRSFLQEEMKAVENHLVEKIRSKSAEVFKELFRGVAESIKDTAVKNAIEDMSIPTCPSKDTGNEPGAGSSRSK